MSYPISNAYRKDQRHDPGHGYGRYITTQQGKVWLAARPAPMSSEVVHTTSNKSPTSIEHEAKFLRDSPNVSCNDLIGKDGTIYVILPEDQVAWHSGTCLAAWNGIKSFGTELHCSVGEQVTAAQKDALKWRMQQRIAAYGIARKLIETHRFVARPVGRKKDPGGWLDRSFYAWRDALYDGRHYRTIYEVDAPRGARVRQGPSVTYPVAAVLPHGATFYSDEVVPGEAPPGETISQWAHYWGPDENTPAALGFVWLGILEEIPA